MGDRMGEYKEKVVMLNPQISCCLSPPTAKPKTLHVPNALQLRLPGCQGSLLNSVINLSPNLQNKSIASFKVEFSP